MDRRSFVGFGVASLAVLAVQWAAPEPQRLARAFGGARVDGAVVDWLEAGGNGLAVLPTEQRRHAARLMDAQLATVTGLLADGQYDGRTGRRLHRLAASLASTCGWYRFDQGRHAAAGRMWEVALLSAHAAGDRDRVAGVLADTAYQATWLGRPRASADRLGYALTGVRHPAARALLLLRRARADAALGERAACYRDLAAAERALDGAGAEPPPGWCCWMGPADLAVDSGRCLLDLGHPAAARTRIAEGVALLPPARDKTRAVFLTYQARALLRTGEVEQALAATAGALDLSARIGAPRCVSLVRDLAPALARHRRVDGVPEFLDRLTTV
ncbi:XRE family transcriptional regulator [Kitasatospora sp. NPDC088134]|uniref:XRE family transcriptional regulator n=1 Tax=Kitasatospora sp. NPDC088134 TaxID=3364071 RepID=UPI00381E6374